MHRGVHTVSASASGGPQPSIAAPCVWGRASGGCARVREGGHKPLTRCVRGAVASVRCLAPTSRRAWQVRAGDEEWITSLLAARADPDVLELDL